MSAPLLSIDLKLRSTFAKKKEKEMLRNVLYLQMFLIACVSVNKVSVFFTKSKALVEPTVIRGTMFIILSVIWTPIALSIKLNGEVVHPEKVIYLK